MIYTYYFKLSHAGVDTSEIRYKSGSMMYNCLFVSISTLCFYYLLNPPFCHLVNIMQN
jgi:hypothetical protein